jgi:hypothetical protein
VNVWLNFPWCSFYLSWAKTINMFASPVQRWTVQGGSNALNDDRGI